MSTQNIQESTGVYTPLPDETSAGRMGQRRVRRVRTEDVLVCGFPTRAKILAAIGMIFILGTVIGIFGTPGGLSSGAMGVGFGIGGAFLLFAACNSVGIESRRRHH